MAFDPSSTEGIIAITFIVVTFVLLMIFLPSCIICWCWRYKLHKRKEELKVKEAEQGIIKTKKKNAGCCRCCGCWIYWCRCCRGCCEEKTDDRVVVVQPVDLPQPTCPTKCGGAVSSNNQQFGWSKDVFVYNTGSPSGVVSSCSSQPVNFNNRWSSCNDGRLVLNAGGVVSRITPGASPYGGIYPSVPVGVSAGDQFLLTAKR